MDKSSEEGYPYAASIDLQVLRESIFNNLGHVNRFAIDIGGSLAKIAYEAKHLCRRSLVCESPDITSDASQGSRVTSPTGDMGSSEDLYQCYENETEEHRLCFIKFETHFLESCLDFIRDNLLLQKKRYAKDHLPDGDEEKLRIKVTGGGAYRYFDMIRTKLGVEVDKEDEIQCLVKGCCFLLHNIPDEAFTYDRHADPAYNFSDSSCMVAPYPFLLVNIGSGVSIMVVESDTKFTRIGGTSLGGGTFWGIGALLTGGLPFDELLTLAERGDHRRVDMLVKDTHGGPNLSLGLAEDIIASSFGLAAKKKRQDTTEDTSSSDTSQNTYRVEDVLSSLLITVSNNIGQIAYLHAQHRSLCRVLFAGYFIRGHPITMNTLTYAVHFWSQGRVKPMFLRHEGYLGAVGAFLKTVERDELLAGTTPEPTTPPIASQDAMVRPNGLNSGGTTSSVASQSDGNVMESGVEEGNSETNHPSSIISWTSWSENYCGSSAALASPQQPPDSWLSKYPSSKGSSATSPEDRSDADTASPRDDSRSTGQVFDRLQLGRLEHRMETFPLLADAASYCPDTWDITADLEARTYWLNCFENSAGSYQQKAWDSQAAISTTAEARSRSYIAKYLAFLQELKVNPCAYGVLTVRCLLDAHQNFLREFGFSDPFIGQKKLENEAAFGCLADRLSALSNLPWAERQLEVVQGLLAGNVFDWGAREVHHMMVTDQDGMDKFHMARGKLQSRPWLYDNFDSWLSRLRNSSIPPHKCVLIFCDNSGFDIIVGVLPFAMECLQRGSKVVLAANSGPAINDVTHSELVILLKKLSLGIPALHTALSSGHLVVCETGSESPCLDLRSVARSLSRVVRREGVDLVVMEGMGRAVHTNLTASLACDCLKVAVIKNAWLANRLGGELFSVVFKYETVP